ncbi:FAD-dependent oxidoreductase [Sphaerisporangium rubeum]|uniref:2-polyprenyl-6-methoxyphenol hydroxylase-like FAD-dependent oxidoreductase n=1 Tax=Sphaerisporangium rubeum TaxID=321317 RepID=A0A7X0M7A3_9ACTN|nr:FAD-dependent monooxygenase [Sphaerisporangium rubeum]MBB6472641.1 2-polyprenyl-6-methoxyphenol hydroxylase-like FAD-dependent oxidoreductase [Sphaerisporangium rubeum]
MGNLVGDRAVVLGGSMAGLLAARVLSEAYAEVTIVDRDKLIGVTTARRGVPQGRHVHGLLARGQQILEELFPGFTAGAVAAGVPTGDLGELRWYFNGVRLKPGTTGLTCVSAARPVLEAHVRKGVEALPNVRFVEETDIVGLVATPGGDKVTGVRVQRHEAGSTEEVLDADLVVDCTGRGSRTPVWLEELGYERPAEQQIKINLTYTTQVFRLPDESILNGDLSINPVSSPSHPRGAFFSRIEGGKSAVSMTGVLGDSAPATPEGFMDFARSLPVPDVYDVIKDAEPLDDPVAFRYPASVRRHYEKLDRFPDRLLVMGDAACSFNPVYGQGMTVAALESLTLRTHLAKGDHPDPRAFLKDIAAVIEVPWGISAGGDLSYPEVQGPRPFMVRMMNSYMAKLQAAATQDGRITRTFMRVAGLVDPPQALMAPGMIFRVLRNAGKAPRNVVTPPVTEPAVPSRPAA